VATDVFVYWTTTERPTQGDVLKVVRDFFGDVATGVHWDHDRFFITLVGKWSAPLARVVTEDVRRMMLATAPESEIDDGRYMEVYIHADALDVITRHQDDFTHACQDGLAKVFARRWKGRIEK
jgi:hypothetical protein